jgi:hypothetical protein
MTGTWAHELAVANPHEAAAQRSATNGDASKSSRVAALKRKEHGG